MKKIEMWMCDDGTMFASEEKAKKHDAKLLIEKEVVDYLKGSTISPGSKTAQKEVLLSHWEKLANHFATGQFAKAKEFKIRELTLDALQTDGASHKQWYLEQILGLVGNLTENRERYEWDEGDAP